MGIMQAMLGAVSSAAAGGIVNPLAGANRSTTTAGAYVVATDGKITFDGVLVNNWYSPTTTNIGASYWVRITKSSGDAPNTNTAADWTSLSGLCFVEYLSGKSGSFLIEISSDSGGSTVVTSGTYSMTVT